MDKNIENKDIIADYMRYLKLERNYSTNTIEAYRNDLEHLMSYCQSEDKDIREVSLTDLEHFAFILHEKNIGARSQARILSGLRTFYKYLTIENVIEENPTQLLDSPIVGKHLPEVLSLDEVDLLVQSIDLSKWEGQRNRAIIEMFFSCGLRVSELVNLTLSQLYLDEQFIRIIGKGSKERLVPISLNAIKELKLWFMDRNLMQIKPGEQDYVFLNRRGSHLTRTMILIMIKRQAEIAGIHKNISPHTLRHSFATELLKGGADLLAIKAMLGHESINTTEIYTHIDISSLKNTILHFHPRNKLSENE